MNNSADDAGSMLYGGKIDNCKLTGLNPHILGEVFGMLFNNNDTAYNTTSKISSNPLHMLNRSKGRQTDTENYSKSPACSTMRDS